VWTEIETTAAAAEAGATAVAILGRALITCLSYAGPDPEDRPANLRALAAILGRSRGDEHRDRREGAGGADLPPTE
jgi:hypothetical protein